MYQLRLSYLEIVELGIDRARSLVDEWLKNKNWPSAVCHHWIDYRGYAVWVINFDSSAWTGR